MPATTTATSNSTDIQRRMLQLTVLRFSCLELDTLICGSVLTQAWSNIPALSLQAEGKTANINQTFLYQVIKFFADLCDGFY